MKLFRSLFPFIIVSIVFICNALILIAFTEQGELHLLANSFVGGAQDTFFKYYTHIGDGITVPILIVAACVIRRKNIVPNLVLGVSTFAISGLLAQFFKRVVFSDHMRPSVVLEGQLNIIQGVDLHAGHSFPSGHSTVSFAMFIFIAFLFRENKLAQVIAAILAVLAAYSRVHISQHFIEDITAGAILGMCTFFLVQWILNKFAFKGRLD